MFCHVRNHSIFFSLSFYPEVVQIHTFMKHFVLFVFFLILIYFCFALWVFYLFYNFHFCYIVFLSSNNFDILNHFYIFFVIHMNHFFLFYIVLSSIFSFHLVLISYLYTIHINVSPIVILYLILI